MPTTGKARVTVPPAAVRRRRTPRAPRWPKGLARAGERQGDRDEAQNDRLDDRHALERPYDCGCSFPRAVGSRDAEAVEPARARHRRR